jgi:hypothetical protein
MNQPIYRFDFEVRIKSVLVGNLRLYGRQEEQTKCLFVSTHDDYTFVFTDFVIEINT